jgi:ubiquinone/menaquinone biosynthesis C-methylase UbiE
MDSMSPPHPRDAWPGAAALSALDPSAEAWQRTAARWIGNADRIAAMTAGASEALIERLAPARGERVLDVASGAGDPSLRIAALVGATGAVLATDLVPEMLAALRERARRLGLGQVDTLVSDAESLTPVPASFDAACSRFGVMFFADPERALAAMARAVRPGGRLVLAAWSAREANPYFTLAMDALDAAGVPPLELPVSTRTVFEFAEPGRLAATATRAGWREVRSETIRFEMRLPGCAPGGLLDAYADLSDKVSDRLLGVPDVARVRAQAALAAAAAPFERGPDIAFPAESLLVIGRV